VNDSLFKEIEFCDETGELVSIFHSGISRGTFSQVLNKTLSQTLIAARTFTFSVPNNTSCFINGKFKELVTTAEKLFYPDTEITTGLLVSIPILVNKHDENYDAIEGEYTVERRMVFAFDCKTCKFREFQIAGDKSPLQALNLRQLQKESQYSSSIFINGIIEQNTPKYLRVLSLFKGFQNDSIFYNDKVNVETFQFQFDESKKVI
jgi:hypothetical protein